MIFLDYKFFGLQNGDECYCGNSTNKLVPAPSAECNKYCSGSSVEICGGLWRMSVYTTRKRKSKYIKVPHPDHLQQHLGDIET